ncbi:preprotein translocase subunit SecY [Glycomyces sp. L485]|uniref:preprotein translocase subunit SecY n=1 Tax=Glycomyces sp. L485 TaxID=2909235 RepID=UPI001F4A8B56|nr:preprotein translocase subunit SecY [Glycomyces sp. L485]MCH7233113.1 preprotein translocase subunit SecY [Glycomyces sp. L485]
MLSAFISAFRTPDLRKKILFTLMIIALYRLGAQMPSPGVDYAAVQSCLDAAPDDQSGVFGLLNLFTGGALLQLSVFALGVMPYITASIIMQLLTVVIPRLEQLRKEGQPGQTKITQYTRYLTLGLGLLQASAYIALARSGILFGQECAQPILPDLSTNSEVGTPYWLSVVTVVAVMVAGTAMIMWFGEQITEHGVGNGMSLMIFASIAAQMPGQFWGLQQSEGWFMFSTILAVGIAIMVAVVFIEQSQRRIPVQYAKKMVGRRMYGGTSTYIPLKVNQAGIIPVIFGSSLLYIPTLFLQLNQSTDSWWTNFIDRYLIDQGSWVYILVYTALIVFFTYFYVSITFKVDDVAENMKKAGGFIPGVRPGNPTATYLQRVLSRLTFPGSIYLATIAILPNLAIIAFGNDQLFAQFPFGGTSVLIMVGVGLESVKQIESQLMQRHYEGFLR